MDATDIRRERLKQWIQEEFDGRVASLCRYYDLPGSMASYLSQLLSGHRVFGERAARNLEQKCRRPVGWLDTSPKPEEVEVLRFDRQRCAKLKPEDRELIESFIVMILDRNDRLSVKRLSETRVTSTSSPEIRTAARKPVKSTFEDANHGAGRKRRTAR